MYMGNRISSTCINCASKNPCFNLPAPAKKRLPLIFYYQCYGKAEPLKFMLTVVAERELHARILEDPDLEVFVGSLHNHGRKSQKILKRQLITLCKT